MDKSSNRSNEHHDLGVELSTIISGKFNRIMERLFDYVNSVTDGLLNMSAEKELEEIMIEGVAKSMEHIIDVGDAWAGGMIQEEFSVDRTDFYRDADNLAILCYEKAENFVEGYLSKVMDDDILGALANYNLEKGYITEEQYQAYIGEQ